MPKYDFPAPLASLVDRHLRTGRFQNEDDVLMAALNALEFEEQDWAAVNESLKSLQAGETGVTLTDAFAAVRDGRKFQQP